MNTAQNTASQVGSAGILTATVVFGAFVLKLVDLLKYLRNTDWNGAGTLLLTWIVGFIAIQIFIKTQWGDEIKVGDETLNGLTTGSKIVFGLAVPSLASLLYDAKKAVDNTDTASTPRLGPQSERERQQAVKSALGVQ